MNYYNVGTSIVVKGSFFDEEHKEAADPEAVHFDIEYPGNRHVIYTYGQDPEVERLDVGVYRMIIVGTFGYHGYRIYSDAGIVTASEEGEFFVR